MAAFRTRFLDGLRALLASDNDDSDVIWCERAAELPAPTLDTQLTGWHLERRRASHLNASSAQAEKRYFLKWFFHRPSAAAGRVEWHNALRLSALGIPTVEPVGWGRHPTGSFIVLLGAPGLQADERLRRGLRTSAALEWTEAVARSVASLHDANLCHRDLNVYHILLEDDHAPRLIDVGRVTGIGRLRPRRWLVKDLASLHYSAQREGFPAAVARRFLRVYLASSRRRWQRRALLERLLAKSGRYRRHNERKERRGEPL